MFLGVDGGGSKTEFLLLGPNGQVVTTYCTGGSYHLDIGVDGVASLLDEGLRAITAAADIGVNDIKYAFFGFPAYGEDSATDPLLEKLPARWFPNGNFACENDMICAWAGSLDCADGIALVAGTGSIGYGMFGDRTARSGGWGEMFGDEGSAYWISCQGLQAFSKMSDGRQARGPLYEQIRSEFQLANDLDLSSRLINSQKGDRGRIASLSKLIASAAAAGDVTAIGIFDAAAAELADIVVAIARKLDVPAGTLLPVSYAGGVFQSGALILDPLRNCLRNSDVTLELRKPLHSAVMGAARLAERLAGAASGR